MSAELGTKRLGLLQELVPRAARVAVLVNPNNPLANAFVTDVTTAAAGIGLQVEVLTASTSHDIDTAFATLVERRADALLVGLDPLFVSRRVQLATLAARHAVPTIYFRREFTAAGGLMSYGTSAAETYRQLGIFRGLNTDKIGRPSMRFTSSIRRLQLSAAATVQPANATHSISQPLPNRSCIDQAVRAGGSMGKNSRYT
jgi:hypothetical protein